LRHSWHSFMMGSCSTRQYVNKLIENRRIFTAFLLSVRPTEFRFSEVDQK
jgi:hypothetical protein